MSESTTSTLAQLLFNAQPALNFAHVVSELDTALARYPADRRSLSWDCDDVAVFDLDGSRIVLGYSDHLTGQHAACLTVSVGHGPKVAALAPLAHRRSALCHKITDRLSSRYAIDEVVWHETDSPVTPELIDKYLEKLPGDDLKPGKPTEDIDRLMSRMSVELESRLTQPLPAFERPHRNVSMVPAALRARPGTSPSGRSRLTFGKPPLAVANDLPQVPRIGDADTTRIRAALYPAAEIGEVEAPSTQIRLAVHAMNATMIVVFLPVGAAMMTYSILRGEDMRVSGRLLVLAGTIMALGQSEVGRQVISLI